MGAEQTRAPGARSEAGAQADDPAARSSPAPRPPPARSAAPASSERTYSEQQVAEILQRAARLERPRALQKPELSLSEVEAIARESGLDPSLVRVAARSLEQPAEERGFWTRIAGAPVRRSFERVIDGELSAEHHEGLVADLRSALVPGARRPPTISSVGRTLTANVRAGSGIIEVSLTPRDGKTLLRIDVDVGQMAGGTFGGLGGGLGCVLSTMAIGVTQVNHLGPAAAILAVAGTLCGTFAFARGFFGWGAGSLFRRMEQLADALERRVREELGGSGRAPDR